MNIFRSLCLLSSLVFVGAVTFVPNHPGGFKQGAEPDGFRGIRWGTEAKSLSGLKFVKTDPSYGGIKIYTRESDELRIGGATLEGIYYHFWDGKLWAVNASTKGVANWQSLREAAIERFGDEYLQGYDYAEDCSWNGSCARLTLKYDVATQTGTMSMSSEKVFLEMRRGGF